jgi:SAM-dependent methyltransferase
MVTMEKRKIKYQGISTLEVLVDAKNYNKWISDSIKQYVHGKTLEIGAGTGNLTKYFTDKKPLYVTETDQEFVKLLKKKFITEKDVFIERLDITKKPPKKFVTFFSTIFAVNVLEHIENDVLALKNIKQMLQKNGKLLLLVPAKKRAYTKLDQELGHYRRYEKKELIDKLEHAGYEIEKIYFFNFVGLLSWAIRDKVKKNDINLKPYHIKIFDSIVPVLRTLESMIKVPLGISLIVIAKKV